MFRDSIELTGPTVEEATRRALHALGITRPDAAHVEVLSSGSTHVGWSWERRPARVRVTRHTEGFGYVARNLPASLPEPPQPLALPSTSVLSRPGGVRSGSGSSRRVLPKPILTVGMGGGGMGSSSSAPQPSVRSMGIEPSRAKLRAAYQPDGEDNRHVEEAAARLMAETQLDFELAYEHGEYQRIMITLPDRDAGLLIGRRGAGIDALEHLLDRMVSHAAARHVPVQVDVNDYRARQDDERRERALELARKVLQSGEEIHLEPMNPRDRRVVHLAIQSMSGLATYTIGEGARRHIVITRQAAEESS